MSNAPTWPPAGEPDRWHSESATWPWHGCQVQPPLPPAPSARTSLGVPRWLVWWALAWLVVVGLWVPALSSLAESHATGETVVAPGASLGGAAVVATLSLAGRLGYERMWRRTLLMVLAGTCVLLFWYVAVTLTAPDPTNQNDHAAAVAAIVLALPTAVLVAILVAIGALGGRALARAVQWGRQPTW